MTEVHFDIETIPSQLPWVREYYTEKTPVPTPPGNIKKQETIDKWMAENKHEDAVEAAISKSCFSGATNHIVAISWAFNDDAVQGQYISAIEHEHLMLKNFFDAIKDLSMPIFCGHNIVNFDLRVIKQRAMVLGIEIPHCFPVSAKAWDKNIYDTMLEWDSDRQNMIKMDLLARALGIEGKSGIDGSMVYPMWKEGKFAEIATYCGDDVRMGREIYNKMTFKNAA